MKAAAAIVWLAFALSLSAFAGGEAPAASAGGTDASAPECVPFTRALEKAGENACIMGKVVDIRVARSGMTYLDFCRDYRDCGFAVAVAPADARRFGNLRALKNREIQITGNVFRSGHLAGIVWRNEDQLLVATDPPEKASKQKR